MSRTPEVRDLATALEQEMVRAVDANEAVPALLMRSPDGTIWRVTISNTGVLTTAAVQGPGA